MSGQEIVFALLGVVAVGSAILVVTTRRLVHAALWLVVSFGALAGGYLVLTAEFVAWVQVLIYVGAIVVLLLFGIMLTRAPIGESADLDSGNRWAAGAVAAATAAVLVTVMVIGFRDERMPLREGGGSAEELGAAVFRTWVLPFEVLSVLLLASLVGAIVLSRPDIRARPEANGQARSGPGKQARPGLRGRSQSKRRARPEPPADGEGPA
ncbi:NADH-quinone oxidoreductase subunit J [Actinomadura sp. B10D3]|uniref:NADH-quinone oxidoreductase subunit J family protein n=1 Tax=Actinomadura sp. B10D3 TaxID=3153557 RepID=UPI00325CF4DC